MRAMRLFRARSIQDEPLSQVEIAKAEPGRDEIRLQVQVCGVCHTDLHTVEGDLALPRLPIIPGHQVVGLVDKCGPGAERHQVGDRVGVAWLNWSCGRCHYCQSGRENLCPEARFTGLHTDGGYAEYMAVNEQFAYPLPATFSDAEAAPLLCAGIVGYRALCLSAIEPGQRLGLYGFGASAHLVIQVANHWGCQTFVFTRSQAHRELAEELGAIWTGRAEEACPEELDSGVIFAPAGWIVPHALSHLRPGGTLAINAIHMSPIPKMPYNLIYDERVLRSVANFTRHDAEAFLNLAAEIPIRTTVELFALEQANEVLQALKDSRIRASAALQVSAR
jgi:alcohol dehydrogenase, propanol-preferring